MLDSCKTKMDISKTKDCNTFELWIRNPIFVVSVGLEPTTP